MTDNSSLYQQIRGNLSITDCLRLFVLTKDGEGLTKKTLTYYQEEIVRFREFANSQGVTAIKDITPLLIRLFLQHMGETRNKGGVHATWRPIRAMLLWYETEMEPEDWKNPAHKIKIPAPKAKALPGIKMDDFQKLIEVCKGGETWQRDRALFYCLLDSCARAFEFINLNLGDCDLVTGDVLIKTGKGGEPRYVQFGAIARKEVRKYLRSREDLGRDAPLFTTKHRQRFTYDGLVSLVRWRSHMAGIPQPGLHDIRRAGALEMLRNGADIATISKYLGHQSIEVTMRYLAITTDDIRRMHRKASPVDNLIGK